eukprot:UN02800
MVEQSYLQCSNVGLKNLCDAAEAFADADIIDDYIMGAQGGAWSILPQLALLSTTRPCRILKGRIQSRMGFPQQLGKIGKTNRQKVSLIETYHHIESKTSGQLTDFRLQFMPVLNDKLSYILLQADD